MNYVLMVGPKLIITDNMILDGSLYLLDQAGVQVNEYITINDHIARKISPKQTPTHIIILGTPWVWDRCWESAKYHNLKHLILNYPNAKSLFMGVGSCYPLGKENQIKDDIKSNINKLIDIFQDSTVIVRDSLAYDTLEQFKPVLLPCPAFYAMEESKFITDTLGPVMFWYDPGLGITSVDFAYGSRNLDNYKNCFKEEYDKYKPKVYCVSRDEQLEAYNCGLGEPEVLQSSTQTKLIMRHASRIFSGRVHLAVPAHRLNKEISLIQVDSRAKTFYYWSHNTNGVCRSTDSEHYKQPLNNWYRS